MRGPYWGQTTEARRVGTLNSAMKFVSWQSPQGRTNAASTFEASLSRDAGEHSAEFVGMPKVEQSTSLGGPGGFHSSLRMNGKPFFCSVNVYFEVRNGQVHGIAVFKEPWKIWSRQCVTDSTKRAQVQMLKKPFATQIRLTSIGFLSELQIEVNNVVTTRSTLLVI